MISDRSFVHHVTSVLDHRSRQLRFFVLKADYKGNTEKVAEFPDYDTAIETAATLNTETRVTYDCCRTDRTVTGSTDEQSSCSCV